MKKIMPKTPASPNRKPPSSARSEYLRVDLASLLSIDHRCGGCAEDEPCCCATYEVCVTEAEMNRIIRVLPEAAKLCPHLESDEGYDNVFERVERGLYALDTTEDGLCLLAYRDGHTIRCSLHSVALAFGIPLEKVKPKACLLWPMSFSEGDEVLSLTGDAQAFRCNSRRTQQSRRLSPSLLAAIEVVYGKDMGSRLKIEAGKGVRRCVTVPRE